MLIYLVTFTSLVLGRNQAPVAFNARPLSSISFDKINIC